MGCAGSKNATTGSTKKKSDKAEPEKAEQKYDQVAGHENAMKFEGDRMTKTCNIEEIQNYSIIYDQNWKGIDGEWIPPAPSPLLKLQPFVPKFYGGD